MAQSKIEIVEEFFRRVWEEEDPGAIDDLFAPEGEAVGIGEHVYVGPDAFKGYYHAIREHLRDIRIEVDDWIEQGDKIAFIASYRAVDKESGEPVAMSGQALCEIKNGKITKAYTNWDFMGLFGQMKRLPPDSFARMLSGETIA